MVLSMLAIMFVEVCVLVFVSFVCLPAKDKQIREFDHEYKRHYSMEVVFGGHERKLLAPYEELPRIMHELFPDIFEEI